MIRRLGFSLFLLSLCGAFTQNEAPMQLLVDVVEKKTSAQVDGLSASNFRVTVDGKPTKVLEAERRELRSHVVVLLDSSGSMDTKWEPAIDLAEQVLESLRPQTEVSLLPFSDPTKRPLQLVPASEALPTLEAMRKPTNGKPLTKGLTTLWDAMNYAIEAKKLQINDALVLISDGDENHSHDSLASTKKLVSERGIRIFVLYLFDSSPLAGENLPTNAIPSPPPVSYGPLLLHDFVNDSGGAWLSFAITSKNDRREFSEEERRKLPDLGLYVTRRILYPYVLTLDLPNQAGKFHIDLVGVDQKHNELIAAKRHIP